MAWSLFKKPKRPKMPDFTKLAEQTAASSQDAQTRADFTDRPTIKTPWGTESWQTSSAIDPATGKPITQWTQNTELNPLAQRALDAQQNVSAGRSELAGGMLNRLQSATDKPFDWNSMPARANAPTARNIDAGVGDASRQRVEQGMLNRLRPERDYQAAALDTQLANQGLTPGSAAYERAKQQQGDQFSRDEFNALEAGGREQQLQFGMARDAADQGFGQDLQAFSAQNQNRQAAIGEQAQQRNMPLNELNALLSGQQVGDLKTPDFNTSRSTGGADYSGAGQDSYDANMNVYNQKMAGYNRNMNAVTNVVNTAAKRFSDVRLKSNIVRIGTHPIGVGIYEYDIFGRRERGVMAQELIHVAPDLVRVDGSGFYKVDYAGL